MDEGHPTVGSERNADASPRGCCPYLAGFQLDKRARGLGGSSSSNLRASMPPLPGSLASPRLHALRAARNTFGVRSLLLRQEEDSAPEPSCCCCCCSSIPTPADWIIKLNTCRQSHSNPATLLGSLVPPGRLWPSTRERLSEKQARKGAEESGGRGRTAARRPREGAPHRLLPCASPGCRKGTARRLP